MNKNSFPLHFDAQLLGEKMEFFSTYGIFSPKEIDKGTLLLLQYLDCYDGAKVLDLGCGYGAIGLTIAKKFTQSQVHLVDKDFVAIECTNFNILHNKLINAKSYLSNGLSDVEGKFDRIYCNLPAKIGNELTAIFLQDCKQKLNQEGLIQWVCINGLRKMMQRMCLEIFGNYKKIKQGQNYTVFKAIKLPLS